MSSQSGFFDHPRVGKAIVTVLGIGAVVALLSDLFYEKHGHFEFEHAFGFHAAFGFLAYLTIVNTAKVLRRIVKRPQSYYDEGPNDEPR
jgi:hypothetical protein